MNKFIKVENHKNLDVERFNKESKLLANYTNKPEFRNIEADKSLLSRNKYINLYKSEPIIKPLFVSKSFVPVYQSLKPLYLSRQCIPKQTLSLTSVDNFHYKPKRLFSKSISFCSLNVNNSFTSSLKTCSSSSVTSNFSGLNNDICTSKDFFLIKNTKPVLSKSSLLSYSSNGKENSTKDNCSSNTSLLFQNSLYNNTSKSSICVSTTSKVNSTAFMSKTTRNSKIYKPKLLSKISSKHSCLKSLCSNSIFEPRETEQKLYKDNTFFSKLLSCNFTVNNFLRKNENIFKSFYPTNRLHDEVMMNKSNELPSFVNWIANEKKQKRNSNKQKETIKICEYFYLKDETSIEYYKKFPKERRGRNDFSTFVSTIDLKK